MFKLTTFGAGDPKCSNSTGNTLKWVGSSRSLALGACLSVLASSGPALADFGKSEVSMLFPSNIEVKSVGFNYTEVSASSTTVKGTMRVELDAGASGRVKRWSGSPVFSLEAAPGSPAVAEEFHAQGSSATYSIPRPKSINTYYPFDILRQHYASFVLLACNINADKLRSEGMSESDIFGEDRPVPVAVTGTLDYEMSGVEGAPVLPQAQSFHSFPKVTVICKGDSTPLDPVEHPIAYSNVTFVESNSLSGSCTLKLAGTISTREPNSNVKFLYVDDTGKQSDLKTVTTNAAGNVNFQHSYPAPGSGKKSGKIRMVGQSPAFMSSWTDYETNCLPPANGLATALPPKAFHLEGNTTAERVELQGRLCPVRANLTGIIKGRGKASGVAAVLAKGQPKGLKQYDVEDGDTVIVEGQYVLNWANTNARQQFVKLELVVTGKTGELLDRIEKMQAFHCTNPQGVAQVQAAPGGLSTGKPDPWAGQTLGKSAPGKKAAKPTKTAKTAKIAKTPKVGGPWSKPFTILSPKGAIKLGLIRLKGGNSGAKYRLRFLRKTKSGAYKAVGARQLPRLMTGQKAKFRLSALSGGPAWRLEVCPKSASAKRSCKTSDFTLPAKTPRLSGKKQ